MAVVPKASHNKSHPCCMLRRAKQLQSGLQPHHTLRAGVKETACCMVAAAASLYIADATAGGRLHSSATARSPTFSSNRCPHRVPSTHAAASRR
eukprot:UN2347